MSAAVPVTPVSVTVRLTITHSAGWGRFARHVDTTFTDATPIVAFARAYRYARFLMGGRGPDRPAWMGYQTSYGWSLETMDAHCYRVRLITTGQPSDGPGEYVLGGVAASARPTRSTPTGDGADTEWLVTVPLTQTVPAATPAEAIARACQCVEETTTLWWPAINDHHTDQPGITADQL